MSFEIFVRALPQVPWYEFHVTPNNHHLELCWPGDRKTCLQMEEQRGYEAFIVSRPIIESHVRVCEDQQYWQVLTKISAELISGGKPIRAGQDWTISLCRYDAFQDERPSVLSTTSPYCTRGAFSRQQEWSQLRFVR